MKNLGKNVVEEVVEEVGAAAKANPIVFSVVAVIGIVVLYIAHRNRNSVNMDHNVNDGINDDDSNDGS